MTEQTMPEAIRVLLAMPIGSAGVFMRELPIGSEHKGLAVVNLTQDGAAVYRDAADFDAMVVVLSPQLPNFDIEVVQRLLDHAAHPIITIGLVPSADDWGPSLERAGAMAFLREPATQETVERLKAMAPSLIAKAYGQRASASYIPRLDPNLTALIAAQGYRKSVIACYSPKGGVGKTTLAANLAVALGAIANRPTCLLDTNMNGGDAHIHLDLRGHMRNILSLTTEYSATGKMTPDLVKRHVSRFRTSRLDVLAGIESVEVAGDDSLRGDQGARLIEEFMRVARQMYDFVVVDMGSSLNVPLHRACLASADLILLMTIADVASVEDARKITPVLEHFTEVGRERLQLVINMWSDESGLRLGDVINRVELPGVGAIPLAERSEMSYAVNKGEPFVLLHFDRRRDDPVVKAIGEVVAVIYPPFMSILTNGHQSEEKPRQALKRNGKTARTSWLGKLLRV